MHFTYYFFGLAYITLCDPPESLEPNSGKYSHMHVRACARTHTHTAISANKEASIVQGKETDLKVRRPGDWPSS